MKRYDDLSEESTDGIFPLQRGIFRVARISHGLYISEKEEWQVWRDLSLFFDG